MRGATSFPAYLALFESGELGRRAEAARAALSGCELCPRLCAVDRLAGEKGVCRTGRDAKVSAWFAHHGEEDCLRGARGSGTVFFSFCNLGCVFCQNWDTSSVGAGEEKDAEALAAIFLEVQELGCHNLNLVTPEHVVPQVLEALLLAVPEGLRLPIVYNTSAYDGLESLRLMDGVVDVYMPDLKLDDERLCRTYLRAPDYAARAKEAIREMHRQVGDLAIDGCGLARRGVLVRHLIMPGLPGESRAILRWLADELGPETFVNVMGQYHPNGRVLREPERFPGIARRTTTAEHAAAVAIAREAGLTRLAE